MGTSWSYSVDNGSSFTPGSGTTFDLITGTYKAGIIQIKSKDNAGNESEVSKNTSKVVVNTNTPEIPTVKFPDTNSSTGLVTVTLGTNASYWAYSVDSGKTFNQGSGNQFTLGSATYEENQIRVKNMTNTGTESSTVNNKNKITVDTGVVGNPIVTWPVDDPLKYPTSKNEITVTLGKGASSWKYSVDNGKTFNNGSGSTFTLNEGTYEIGKIIITNQNDVGTSSSISNSYVITIDSTSPVITLTGGTPTVSLENGVYTQTVEKGGKWVAPTTSVDDNSTVTVSPITPIDINNVASTIYTYTSIDAAQNKSTVTLNVTVQDTTPPILTVTPPTTTPDGITKIGESKITTEPGSKVEVSSDGGQNFTTLTTSSSGT